MVKVTFDLDGVLYESPHLYTILVKALMHYGVKVGVLSGHSQDSGDRVLSKLQSMGYPRLDFYYGRREEDMSNNEAVRKSQVILSKHIDIHVDDFDFDYPTTERLFNSLGARDKILRVRSKESGKLG